ncbi:GGDEF domain-containing protein [Vibrio sp. FNV 38]|nr:GGDEF domain-containing protein [Vibrio sp. FNV 38]
MSVMEYVVICILKWFFLLLYCISTNVIAQPPTYKVAIESDDIVSRTIFDSVGQHLNLSIDYVYYPSFSAVLSAVERGDADFAANVTYTPERAKRFDYSSPTNIEYTYLYSLSQIQFDQVKTIGIPAGTIYGELIESNYPEIDQLIYFGTQEAKNLLTLGRVDAVVDAINQLKPMLSDGIQAQLLNDKLSIRPVSIIVPSGEHRDLLGKIETFVQSGSLQKTLREQVQRYQFALLQDALRDEIRNSPIDLTQPLRIKLQDLAPFSHYQLNGEIVGITVDILKKSCAILQLNCQIESQANESWDSMYDEFKQGQIDILGPLTLSEERKAFTHFVDAHYFPEAVMVKRKGYKHNIYNHVSELIVERIGVVKGDFFADLLAYLLPQKTLYPYRDVSELINALVNEEIDFIALDRANYNHIMRTNNSLPIEIDDVIGPFYRSNIAIGLVHNERGKQLAPFFDRALAMIDRQAIIQQYDQQPNWRSTFDLQQQYSQRVTTSLIVLFSIAVTIALYLNHVSKVDNLTGIYNRRALMRRFSNGIPKENTLIYIDIDHFKQINDTYGHAVGDEVLKRVANSIRKDWRGHSYRIGGDEFVLIGKESASRLEFVIGNLTSLKLVHDGKELSISVSIGAVAVDKQHSSLDEIMAKADVLMYRMKREGRVTEKLLIT